MKRVQFIPILFCLCFLFISTMVNGQGYIIFAADDGGPCIGCPVYNDRMFFRIPNIRVSNLDDYEISPLVYSLPPNVEPMFIEFSGLGTTRKIPVTEFMQDTEDIYRSISQKGFTIFYNEFCKDKTSSIESEIIWRLVDEDDNDYPVQEPLYSNPDGIFSCEVFAITCHHCNDDCEPMPSNPVKSWTITVDCGDNVIIGPGGPKISKYSSNNSNFNQLAAFPNPVAGQLNLEYTIEQTASVSLSIFNNQGQIMVNTQGEEDTGFHQKTFDTTEWPNGIYFAKIESGGRSDLVKIIKLD